MPQDLFPPTPLPQNRTGVISVRFREDAQEWVDQRATAYGVSRSEIIKAALALAASQDKKFGALLEERKSR